ncbi:MAG: NAD(P)H-dependent glycerol-3-phosphate dehydrogenase [Clostridia bacterium]|nr:NAD(P)H-dependent glycerol-3-phosphate dehydrogenase [Clostridia bacterium]MBR3715820.1 NAD(P)H-dependent glycerol-3-phosphate dehydrogenase [Clostridia bacterium]
MKITVIGCGRWGTLLAWYLDGIGHNVTLYGRANSRHMQALMATRRNDVLELSESVSFSTSLSDAKDSEIIIISIDSQGLRALFGELSAAGLTDKHFVLCMKGIEISTGKRLSEVADEFVGKNGSVSVWVGPGHVQEFYAGVPNCMVIDSKNEEVKKKLVDEFSSDLIRLYYGDDLIGSEIGAAAKNVIGIAAGMLDGKNLSSLKGALMARGAREIARLIKAMGGNELSAYGLCHLGDYEATVFSQFSHNRRFGEAFIAGEKCEWLAEGYYTVCALMKLEKIYNVELPICRTVYTVLYENTPPETALGALFDRRLKKEFY